MVSLGIFPWYPRQNHVPWGRLSLWKWVPGISPGAKAASAYGWRPTTLVVPNVMIIWGLNLPGTPWATLACCRPFPLIYAYKENRGCDSIHKPQELHHYVVIKELLYKKSNTTVIYLNICNALQFFIIYGVPQTGLIFKHICNRKSHICT